MTWKHSTTELGIAQHPYFTRGPHRTSVSKILIILDKCIVLLMSSNLELKNKPFYLDVFPWREGVWISPLYNWLINKHMSAPLGLGLLLMTACMNCQALPDMQQLQHKTKLVSSLQCPSCKSHILCREGHICSLVVLSCRLQNDLLLDTEMESLSAENKIHLS